MTMTSKERAALRAECNQLKPLVHVGQEGISWDLIASLDDALRVKELVKVQLNQSVEDSAKVAAQELAKYGVTVNCLAPTAWSRLTAPLMGGEAASDELKEKISPRWIALIATWLASPEGANVTGRVFDIRGDKLGIAEGWHLGPVATQPDDPTQLGPVVAELMGKARPNASMDGVDHEGPGFPGQTI